MQLAIGIGKPDVKNVEKVWDKLAHLDHADICFR
jgi:hypothetical protein